MQERFTLTMEVIFVGVGVISVVDIGVDDGFK